MYLDDLEVGCVYKALVRAEWSSNEWVEKMVEVKYTVTLEQNGFLRFGDSNYVKGYVCSEPFGEDFLLTPISSYSSSDVKAAYFTVECGEFAQNGMEYQFVSQA